MATIGVAHIGIKVDTEALRIIAEYHEAAAKETRATIDRLTKDGERFEEFEQDDEER